MKLQIRITQVYRHGRMGSSRSMTIEGVSIKQAYNRIKELFEEV